MKRVILEKNDYIIYGMARIGYIPPNTTKTIEVYVNTDDPGKIPHFHVRKYGKNRKFDWEVCIRFESAEYFSHGAYKGKLPNQKIAKELDKMLRTVDKSSRGGFTYWELAIDEWNRNNSDILLPEDLEQPNYNLL